MTTRALTGVAALTAGMLLVELMGYRLCAATVGGGFAAVVAATAPAAAAAAAFLFASRPRLEPAAVARRVAHLAGIAGGATLAATIAVAWASQQLPKGSGELSPEFLAAAGLGWLVAAGANGAALGNAARYAAAFVGRFGFAEGLGAALASLAAPLLLQHVGAPRALLACALLHTVAAFAFASVGRAARPRLNYLVALPLAVVALVAGDIGDPWLNVRTDLGRHARVEQELWTPHGLISVTKSSRSQKSFSLDGSEPVELGQGKKGEQKPDFETPDLGYLLNGKSGGAALVIGSGGGRELQVALAHGYDRVDAVEHDARVVRDVLMSKSGFLRGAELRGAAPSLVVHVGEPRATVAALPDLYRLIVVVGAHEPSPAPPRLLDDDARLYTAESIAAYLQRLDEKGMLVLVAPIEALARLLATADEALRAAAPEAAALAEHAQACSAEGRVALLVRRAPLSSAERQKLVKNCKKKRHEVEFPPEEPRREKRRGAEPEPIALPPGRAIRDDAPFLEAPLEPRELEQATRVAVAALGRERKLAAELRKETAARTPEGESSPPSEVPTEQGLAAAGLAGTALLLLVGAIPARRLLRVRTPNGGRAAGVGLGLLGAGTALGLLVCVDRALGLLGYVGYAWSFALPLAFAASAGGRLVVDTFAERRLVLGAVGFGGLALAVLACIRLGAIDLADLAGSGYWTRIGSAAALLLGAGAGTGALATIGLRALAAEPRCVARGWAWHLAGWALGAAAAPLAVRMIGFTHTLEAGMSLLALAVGLVALAAARARRSAADEATQIEQSE